MGTSAVRSGHVPAAAAGAYHHDRSADAQLDLATRAGDGNGAGIGERRVDDLPGLVGAENPQRPGDVPGATRCRIVAGIADEERLHSTGQTFPDAVVERSGRCHESEIFAHSPVVVGQFGGLGLNQFGIVARHHDRRLAAWFVRPGVADPDRGVQNPFHCRRDHHFVADGGSHGCRQISFGVTRKSARLV
jgi:hypothetical protein